ncbi:hypothetical protein OC834_007820 [Tilletia horrida]|nr:hypothetical protein OC834_007820 [Tilletia horrida]
MTSLSTLKDPEEQRRDFRFNDTEARRARFVSNGAAQQDDGVEVKSTAGHLCRGPTKRGRHGAGPGVFDNGAAGHRERQPLWQPKMQVWRSKSLKYIINYPPGLACKDCGLPFFLCRDQTGTSACCSPARNTFLLGVLFALATNPDLFSNAKRRVRARQPKLEVNRPRFGAQLTEIPQNWT